MSTADSEGAPDYVEGVFTQVGPDARAALASIHVDPTARIGRVPILAPEDPQEPIYNRLRGEKMRDFLRFERYRALPIAERSVTRVFKQEAYESGRAPAAGVPVGWFLTARLWAWQKRAEAWDQHQVDLLRAQEVTAKKRSKLERIRQLEDLQQAAATAVTDLLKLLEKDHGALPPQQVLKFVTAINRELRAEYDDNPTKKTRVDGEVDVAHKVYLNWDPKSLTRPPEVSDADDRAERAS